jgi:hypothetical protein
MINLDQGDAGCVARAANDGGKAAGIGVDKQCSFQLVRWRQPCRLDGVMFFRTP